MSGSSVDETTRSLEQLEVRPASPSNEAEQLQDLKLASSDVQLAVKRHRRETEQCMKDEASKRSDFAFRQSLSPIAIKADAIVSRILSSEIAKLWKAPDDASTYPGMPYALGRERMKASSLWQIVKKMPKGALLHAHFDAMADLRWFWGTVVDAEGMVVSSSEGAILTQEDFNEKTLFFESWTAEDVEKLAARGPTIFDKEFDPKSTESAYASLSRVAAAFPQNIPGYYEGGGREAFIDWMVSRTQITKEDVIKSYEGTSAIWDKLFKAFGMISSAIIGKEVLPKYIQHVLKTLYEDGTFWAEFRISPEFGPQVNHSDLLSESGTWVDVAKAEIEKFKRENPGFLGVRFIFSQYSSEKDDVRIMNNMERCIKIKKRYPELVAGYDIVGYEDSPASRPLKDFPPLLYWFKSRCTEEGVSIPFYLHAGETSRTGTPADLNIYDALPLNPRRLGHTLNLLKHPTVLSSVLDQGICIESCPLSNEFIRYTSSIHQHPLPGFLAAGLPVAIGNDDPAVFGTVGLTDDFCSILVGLEGVGLAGLGSLAETSVRFASYVELDGCEKLGGGEVVEGRVSAWREIWEQFCGWVCEQYKDY